MTTERPSSDKPSESLRPEGRLADIAVHPDDPDGVALHQARLALATAQDDLAFRERQLARVLQMMDAWESLPPTLNRDFAVAAIRGTINTMPRRG